MDIDNKKEIDSINYNDYTVYYVIHNSMNFNYDFV